MKQKIYVRPRFRKLEPSEYMDFYNSLRDARKVNRHGLFVLLRDPEVYKDGQNFLLGHGVAGFAIKEGEMISVHKNNVKAEQSGVRHILPKMVRCAFKYGAYRGDCYGEFLADYYSQNGFVAVAYVPFDYVPDNPVNWDYKQFGKPNDYVMMRGVRNVAELDRLSANGGITTFAEMQPYIKRFTNYEEALEYRDRLYEDTKRYGYKSRIDIIKSKKDSK